MDAMVTARMPVSKKELGNEALSKLGTNASAAINNLYDFVIKNGTLPFFMAPSLTQEEIAQRIAFIDSIPLAASNRFSLMSDDEIRRERLNMA